MCEVCRQGHSPPENRLVICDACSRGFHQLCSVPPIQASVVVSDLPFLCADCDKKVAALKKSEDVTEGEWTTGEGQDKGEGKEAEKDAPYAEEVKKAWLEGLPLHTLIGYIFSIEKSACLSLLALNLPFLRERPSQQSMPPPAPRRDLPSGHRPFPPP